MPNLSLDRMAQLAFNACEVEDKRCRTVLACIPKRGKVEQVAAVVPLLRPRS